MTQVLVVDSSALVAMLLDGGPDGQWVAEHLRAATLAAPALLPFEVANIVRRQELAGLVTADQAAQAHDDLVDLGVELWPYELLAKRAWQLRDNLTAYDAGSVAVAELLDAPLLTLDRRLAAAPGLRCGVLVPPA